MSKDEVAQKYNICTKTLKRWCKRANIETGNNKLLPPAVLEKIKQAFGEPKH